jgi:hypothetical protein
MAILIICVGKYKIFLREFLLSNDAMFFPGVHRSYHIVTDDPAVLESLGIPRNFETYLYITNQTKWPLPTILRFSFFKEILRTLGDVDNVFFFNINCRFVRVIEDINWFEHGLISCVHPGYHNKPREVFPYEKRSESEAYVPTSEGNFYYAGGLQGGRTAQILSAYSACEEMRRLDEAKGITAVWHDESYWNKYLLRTPSHKLHSGYLYPEGWELPFQAHIVLLNKNHIHPIEDLRDA